MEHKTTRFQPLRLKSFNIQICALMYNTHIAMNQSGFFVGDTFSRIKKILIKLILRKEGRTSELSQAKRRM